MISMCLCGERVLTIKMRQIDEKMNRNKTAQKMLILILLLKSR